MLSWLNHALCTLLHLKMTSVESAGFTYPFVCFVMADWDVLSVFPSGGDTCEWLLSSGRYLGETVWQPYGCMMHKYKSM